nr:uncharacterized protein LOC133617083 isoform X2 [Nerophis lumbriciformis]
MCEITIAEYKEELSPKEETERQHQLLDAVFKKPEVVLHGTENQPQNRRRQNRHEAARRPSPCATGGKLHFEAGVSTAPQH